MDFISCALLFLFLPQGYARQGEGAARSGKIEVDQKERSLAPGDFVFLMPTEPR